MDHLLLFLDMLLHKIQQIQSVKNFQNKVCLVLKDGDHVTNYGQSFMGMKLCAIPLDALQVISCPMSNHDCRRQGLIK